MFALSKIPDFLKTNSDIFDKAIKNMSFGSFSLAKTEDKDVEIPFEIQGKTVKECLEMFESQLDKQVAEFQKQARRIARWDRKIFDCLALMKHLGTQIETVEKAQDELVKKAEKLLDDQEQFINELKQKEPSSSNVHDQRHQLYEKAFALSKDFQDMQEQLNNIVDIQNSVGNIQQNTNSSSDVEKLTKIVNCQLDALHWIDHQSLIIEEQLKSLSRELSHA